MTDTNKTNKRISYALAKTDEDLLHEQVSASRKDVLRGAKEFYQYLRGEGKVLLVSFFFIVLNSVAGVITPFLVAHAVDTYIVQGDKAGLAWMLAGLFGLYLVTTAFGYAQSRIVGGVSQRTLFRLRSELFKKIQDLPIAFFNQNKVGDLISRINNDTDKLNQFLSEGLPRFVGSFFVIFGIAVFAVSLNWKLGLVMLSGLLIIFLATLLLTPFLERFNKKNLEVVGRLSSSMQENLSNFRVIAAYGKRDYFKDHLKKVNLSTFKNAYRADVMNRILEPIYDFAGFIALALVLLYGFHLITVGQLTVGLLIAYVSYTQRFYDPLRILATIFGTIEVALAAWSRLRILFNLENSMEVIPEPAASSATNKQGAEIHLSSEARLHGSGPQKAGATDGLGILSFRDVYFGYEDGANVLEEVNFRFEPGKTYALVGPTGGGKSTLASLMARLYDPTSGTVYLNGRDIRSYAVHERTSLTSVILQDPVLFTGTVAENIKYGNDALANLTDEELSGMLRKQGLAEIMERFADGLATKITQGSGLSIGQKQLISFMRAVLRKPKLLILDEATANIDTITENLLTKALAVLSSDTTKVIIAHRLNTIKDADEILFVNKSHVVFAGDFDEAVRLIGTSSKHS